MEMHQVHPQLVEIPSTLLPQILYKSYIGFSFLIGGIMLDGSEPSGNPQIGINDCAQW